MRFYDARFEIKSLDDKGEFEGYGSIFGNVDLGGDVVMPGAFSKSLASHQEKGTMPALLWQHDPSQPIGTYTEMREDEKGLWVKGKLTLAVQKAQEAYALLKDRAVRGLSIGYEIKDGAFNKESKVYELKEVDLWETSVVTFPMNPLAQVYAAKTRLSSGETISKRDLELVLRDAGLSRSQAKALIGDGFNALNQRDADDSDFSNHVDYVINKLKDIYNG